MNARGLVKKGEKFRLLAKSKKSAAGRRLKDFGLGPANLPFMGSGFYFLAKELNF